MSFALYRPSFGASGKRVIPRCPSDDWSGNRRWFLLRLSYSARFTPEDLAAIEKKMAEISKRDLKVERKVLERSDAIRYFMDLGEHYKAQIIGVYTR